MALRADDIDLNRDRDLVQRYQAGDATAFDELYRRYFPRLHGYCQRRVGDTHTAEEIAQEAFVRAMRALPRFAGEQRFYPWMTVIAKRLCIDHHRRNARVEPNAVVELGWVNPDLEHLDDAVDHAHVQEALTRVAPRHREVLDLREQQGLSYHEIAGQLDVPVTTVEALLHRARKALRREFLVASGDTGRGLWGLPVLGWLARRGAAIRARIGDGDFSIASIAAPAAAGLASVALVIIPGHHTSHDSEVRVGAPAHTTTVAVTLDPSASNRLNGPRVAAGAAGASGVGQVQQPSGPHGLSGVVQQTEIGIGSDRSRQQKTNTEIATMPTHSQVGPLNVGVDTSQAVTDLVDAVGHPRKLVPKEQSDQ